MIIDQRIIDYTHRQPTQFFLRKLLEFLKLKFKFNKKLRLGLNQFRQRPEPSHFLGSW